MDTSLATAPNRILDAFVAQPFTAAEFAAQLRLACNDGRIPVDLEDEVDAALIVLDAIPA